jgi:uncharacterized protein
MTQPSAHWPHGVDEVVDDVKKSAVPVLLVLGVLVGVNLLTNRLAPGVYLLWAWTGAAVLLLIARRDGESWSDIGLGPLTKRAVLAALGVIAIVFAIYLIGALIPSTREAFSDDRIGALSNGQVLWRALVRVPFGTVVLEEIAFRGVLLSMLWRRIGVVRGMVASSLVFGLWHILPSLGITQSNDALGAAVGTGPSGRIFGVLFVVFSTFLAGLLFCELRRRFGHLIVPMALHWGTNGLGYLFAWIIVTGWLH